ncbi:hypothetical protein CPHLJ_8g3170 [Cryptosporidium parvum]|nr:hypothetical protein CPCDC_8g3170 [Cryptosporidium sp. 43IA8]
MNIIEIYRDGIKCSYSFIISIFSFVILFSFVKFKREKNELIQIEDENLRHHSDFKMTICIRQGMGRGKVASQCGHAVLGAYKKAIKRHPKMVEAWERSGQAKVVLKVSFKELLESERRAKEKNITSCLIKDAGRTQIAAGEYTAIAIGPGPSELIDEITGEYKLL